MLSSGHLWEWGKGRDLVDQLSEGFVTLEEIEIAQLPATVNAFLSSFSDAAPARKLSLAGLVEDGHLLFPEKFAPKQLEEFSCWFDDSECSSPARDNLMEAVARFSALRRLSIGFNTDSWRGILPVTDDQLVGALQSLTLLQVLSINTECRFREPKETGPSLGCLVHILRHCPLLHTIEGAFDLDLKNISEIGSFGPHANLDTISLGTSYFTENEPENWVAHVVLYLSSLSLRPCKITFTSRMCMALGSSHEEINRKTEERSKLQSAFAQCVELANLMKGNSAWHIGPTTSGWVSNQSDRLRFLEP